MNASERLADPSFGNYMLNGLREISLPEPPSYLPQTIGWAILGGIMLVALMLWGIILYQSWRRNRYRRLALLRLQELEQGAYQADTQATTLKELPILLKQTALAAYPRKQVASLSSDRWLTFLDNTYNGQGFTQGEGHLLAEIAYQPAEAIAQLPSEKVSNLISLVRNWIAHHQLKEQ